MEKNIVRVGMGIFIFKNGKFLMLQRHGAHGAGSWSIPGGHIEYGESFEDTAQREVAEETGLKIKNIRFAAATNDFFKEEKKHYITIWMRSDWSSGEPSIMEPEKCLRQGWCTFATLPKALFLPWNQLLASDFIDQLKQYEKLSAGAPGDGQKK